MRRLLIDSVIKARPRALKGKYVKRITVASTMSPVWTWIWWRSTRSREGNHEIQRQEEGRTRRL
jgi:hypothetical protein